VLTILIAVAFVIPLVGAFLWALIDSARRPASAFGHGTLPKNTTIVLILLTGGLGGIYYLLRVRPVVARAVMTPPPVHRMPPPLPR
jgi:hypothetical protein